MEYIILAAGVGSRLYPYTKNSPKCLVKVSEKETVIQRCVRLIKEYDSVANVHIVVGFQSEQIKELLGEQCHYITNPFYKITNSIGSLWFARNVLKKKSDTVILNSDVVFSKELGRDICSKPSSSLIYYDSSIKEDGDYNVQVIDGMMIVMGKELSEYHGEYVGVTKYTGEDAGLLLEEIRMMIKEELYDQWYENALVQMSLTLRHKFKVKDVSDYQWSEIDAIDNLLKIRNIIKSEY